MKLKTTMERFMFACINSKREYEALKFCEKHINEDPRWKESYNNHIRRYNFWQNAANRFAMTLDISSRMEYIIRMH